MGMPQDQRLQPLFAVGRLEKLDLYLQGLDVKGPLLGKQTLSLRQHRKRPGLGHAAVYGQVEDGRQPPPGGICGGLLYFSVF